MFEFGLYVLCAFCLYLVLLPLMGVIVGVVVYVGLPYLAGVAIACIAHKVFHGSFFDLGAFWVLAVLWALVVAQMRQIYRNGLEMEHAWHEGHYLAARTVLMLGQPYRIRKRAYAV